MSGICSWLFAAKAENNQLRGISGLVSRLYLGSISPCGPVYPHDKKICNAFNISMSEFFMEEDTTSVHLNETRFRLLRYAERLNGTQLSSMLKFLESL